jgi:hypothetical protein
MKFIYFGEVYGTHYFGEVYGTHNLGEVYGKIYFEEVYGIEYFGEVYGIYLFRGSLWDLSLSKKLISLQAHLGRTRAYRGLSVSL